VQDVPAAETVAVHSVEPPAAKVTEPVAADGRPAVESCTVLPYEVDVGFAEAVNDVGACGGTVQTTAAWLLVPAVPPEGV